MINVAVLGFGTVGSGVAEVLATNRELIDQRVNEEVRLKYILDVREFPDNQHAYRGIRHWLAIVSDYEKLNTCITSISAGF